MIPSDVANLSVKKSAIYVINPTKNTKKMRPRGRAEWTRPHDRKGDRVPSTFSDILQRFSVQTTIPGVLHVATRKRKVWQYFWVLISIAGLAMSMYQSFDVMMDYIKGRKVQVVDYLTVNGVSFPSVTVCSNVLLDDEKLSPALAEEFCGGTDKSFCTRSAQTKNSYSEREADEDHLMDRVMRFQSRYSSDERQSLFYIDPRKFLESCTWEMSTCNLTNIDHVYAFNNLQSGLCVTINMGITSSMTAGQNGVMNLVFNMDRESRKLKMNEIFCSLWIHPPGTAATLFADNGATVFPGDKIRINFMMQSISRLPSRRCVDENSFRAKRLNPFYTNATPYSYSTTGCQFQKQDEELRIPMKCFHPAVSYHNLSESLAGEGAFCTSNSQEAICTRKCNNFTEKEVNASRAKCKPPCNEIIVRYSANTVSLWLENMVEKSLLVEPDIDDKETEKVGSNLGSEIINESVAILQISPWNNIVETVTEEYKHSYADFLGILGGNFGLWIGLSVISLTELVELFVDLVIRAFKRRRNRINNKMIRLNSTCASPLSY